MWSLEFEGETRAYLETLAERTGVIPGPLLREPVLEPHQQRILDAFFLIITDRPLGMGGVGAIPTTAILEVADLIGEDRWAMLVLCRTLDAVYLERSAKQTARKK